MASNPSPPATSACSPPNLPAWRAAGLRYHSYNFYLRQRYGERVQRVSLDAKLTCPNVDGTVAIGGCVFCDNRSFSPSRRVKVPKITDQLNDGIRKLKIRYDCEKFLAYFQPGTNTYGKLSKLRPLWEEALAHPQVVGLVLGTRPDCVPDDVLDVLTELAAQHEVIVEYGLQTMHDRSLDWMNRGHHYDAFVDAMVRSENRGFQICVHLILGLPGESREDMLATARAVASFNPHAIKVHNLYVVENTPLANWVRDGSVKMLERHEYVELLVDTLEVLPPDLIVERTSGEAPPQYLVGPSWCLDKPGLKTAIEAEFARRNTYQGAAFTAP